MNRFLDRNILVLDDPGTPHEEMLSDFRRRGAYNVNLAFSEEEAERILGHEDISIVIIAVSSDERKGIEYLKIFKQMKPRLPMILFGQTELSEFLMRALEFNAFSYLVEPVPFPELEEIISRALGMDNF